MSERTAAVRLEAPSGLGSRRSTAVQRKCACGTHAAGGECPACSRKKTRLQRKLMVGVTNDPLELEADRIADQILSAPGQQAMSSALPRGPRFGRKFTGQAGTAPPSVDQALSHPGRPLEPRLRHDMDQRFGHDFTQVRVHSGAAAEQSAREVNAQAYTLGRHIVFGSGRFAPGTQAGRHLIAHELSHVVQQAEVDDVDVARASGRISPSPAQGPVLIQRQPDQHPAKEDPIKKPGGGGAQKQPPPQKTLKSEGVDLNDPVARSTAALIDEVLSRNKKLAPYIGDRLKGGFRIAAKGKFIQDSTDGNFDAAYRKAYDLSAADSVSKDTTGFFDSRKSEIHVRPGAKFGTALHESVHRLASPALYSTYLQAANKVSTKLVEALKEGVTALFTDGILKDEGMPNFNDAYRTQKGRAQNLIAALGADGFDLIAKFNFKGTGIIEIGEKLGYTSTQFSASRGSGISEVMKRMDKVL